METSFVKGCEGRGFFNIWFGSQGDSRSRRDVTLTWSRVNDASAILASVNLSVASCVEFRSILKKYLFHRWVLIAMSYQYEEQLSAEASARYKSKLRLLDQDICPYKVAGDNWVNDPKQWPKLQYQDVYHYLVDSPGKHQNQRNMLCLSFNYCLANELVLQMEAKFLSLTSF